MMLMPILSEDAADLHSYSSSSHFITLFRYSYDIWQEKYRSNKYRDGIINNIVEDCDKSTQVKLIVVNFHNREEELSGQESFP